MSIRMGIADKLKKEFGLSVEWNGRFDQFHSAHFRTYFSGGMDIGSLEVLTQIGNESGLDRDALVQVLQTGRYRPRIENIRKERARLE